MSDCEAMTDQAFATCFWRAECDIQIANCPGVKLAETFVDMPFTLSVIVASKLFSVDPSSFRQLWTEALSGVGNVTMDSTLSVEAQKIASVISASPMGIQRLVNAGVLTHEKACAAASAYLSVHFVIQGKESNGTGLPDYCFKLVLVADSNVGKTSVLERFADNSFGASGVELKLPIVVADGTPVLLQIWDTTGQERFRAVSTGYYRNADGIMILYDVTNRSSFNRVVELVRQIQQHRSKNPAFLLLGQMTDIRGRREVTWDEGAALARSLSIPLFLEASSGRDEFVRSAFYCLTKEILKRTRTRHKEAPPL
eukprot:TRINITY_DN7894_c0_g1_i2.p2 TRINITY_DN7894_c0_g1~~TRINITY_DN7894_c0_g1_i2.p2  ORF type:complete len:312 (-),score=17.13 TRINITY_DN7894_c0_g1_i2:122-1057(-)